MKVGIIGGSGLDDPNILEDYEEVEVETKYGFPSSKIICGKIGGVEICILARHGIDHSISPSQVNYRANIFALKSLGCRYIIATSAVGSLREEIFPGDLVFPDQFIDFTKTRRNTFFDSVGEVKHVGMADPFSKYLRNLMIKEAETLGYRSHNLSTIAVIEGPRFSTRAESFMFKKFADVIGMTTAPECALANELGIEYASIAMSTDYDCWKEDEEPVSFEMVMERMKQNAEKVKKLILNVLPKVWNPDEDYIRSKIRAIPNFPKKGIMFRDITTLLKDVSGMERVMKIFVERYKDLKIDVVAGIESRGFIVGGVLASRLGVGFVPIRKAGKLPAMSVREEYDLEYGSDSMEVHVDAVIEGQRVLVVDDLIATGGTARAACKLIEKLGGRVVENAFVVELPDLNGREKIRKWDSFSIVSFEGE